VNHNFGHCATGFRVYIPQYFTNPIPFSTLFQTIPAGSFLLAKPSWFLTHPWGKITLPHSDATATSVDTLCPRVGTTGWEVWFAARSNLLLLCFLFFVVCSGLELPPTQHSMTCRGWGLLSWPGAACLWGPLMCED